MGLFLMEARPLRGQSREKLPSVLFSEQDAELFQVPKGEHGTEDAGWRAGRFNLQWATLLPQRLHGTIVCQRPAVLHDRLPD